MPPPQQNPIVAVFPFADGYSLYGGGCPGADPTKNDPDYYTNFLSAFVSVDPGVATPGVKVRLPSINLRVYYGTTSGVPKPLASTYMPYTRIVVTSTSTNCSEKFIFAAPAIDAQGWMLNPALPFGTYSVCAESRTPGSPTSLVRKTVTGVNNWYDHGMKPPDVTSPVIDLNSSATSGACP